MDASHHQKSRLFGFLIVLGLWAFFSANPVSANSPEISLADVSGPINVRGYAYLINDSDKQMRLPDIVTQLQQPGGLQANPAWRKASTPQSFTDFREKIWLAFAINNSNAAAVNWLLYIDYAMVLDVNFYLVRENGDIENHSIGNRYPFAQRPISHPRPLVPIYLAANENVWMLMSSVGENFMVVQRTQLWQELSFWQQQDKRPLFQMLFNGAAIVLLILIALGYLFSRDISYVFLEVLLLSHVLTSIAHHGFLAEYIWPYPIVGWSDTRVTLDLFSTASILLFADLYLDFSRNLPRLSKFSRYLGYGLLAGGCLYPLIPTSYDVDSGFLGVLFLARVPLLLLVAGLALYRWVKGSVAARNFFWVWLVYVVAYTLMVVAIILEDPQLVERAGLVWDVGILVVSISLVIMLAYKISYYREKEVAARAESRSKSEFLAKMSHEIRTPLTGIIGMSEVLKNNLTEQVNRNYADVINSSGVTLLSIINDVLDFSKIAANKMEVEFVAFSLPKLVYVIQQMFQLRAVEVGVEFVSIIDPEVPEIIKGDPTRFSQVIINLLSNAFKFTHEGRISLEISIDKDCGDFIRVAVSDTGIGIALSARKAIFESFSQAQSSTTRHYGGTGLGLSICKNLTQLMGGEIKVASEENVGSCFSFTCPLTPGEEVVEHNVEPLAGIKLLLVDDDEAIRETIKRQVQGWHMSIDIACSGAEALELVNLSVRNQDCFDLVVSDTVMPMMSGIKFIKNLRALPDYSGVPTILMSATTELPSRQEQLDLGITIAIQKPVHMIELSDIFCAALSGLTIKPEKSITANSAAAASFDILVVEDNQVNCLVIQTMLKNLSHSVTLCNDGIEALEAFDKKSYDLILMDCEMPNMDGFEATKQLRKLESDNDLKRTPVIALTAHATQDNKAKCMAFGMDGYISKPFTIASMEAGIEAVLPTDMSGS